MNITFERKSFLSQLKLAVGACMKRDILPILNCVKIVADKKHGITIHATDKDVGIRIEVDAGIDKPVNKPGEVVISADRLIKSLTVSKSRCCTLTVDKTKAVLSGDAVERWEFPLEYKPEEYPYVTGLEPKSYHLVNSNYLLSAIQRTVFAAEKPNTYTRYIEGACFESRKDEEKKCDIISVTATDGFRLATQELPASCIKDHFIESVNIPSKALRLVEKALKDKTNTDVTVSIAICKHTITFQFNNTTIFSKLLDGKFPDWKFIFWDTNKKIKRVIAITECGTLLSAIETIIQPKESSLIMSFGDAGILTLEIDEKQFGKSKTTVPVVCDGLVTAAITAKHLLEMLKILDPETSLTFYMNGYDGIIIRAGNNYRYAVMPQTNPPYRAEQNGKDLSALRKKQHDKK